MQPMFLIDETDAIIAYGIDGEPIHVLCAIDDPKWRYYVAVRNIDGSEMVLHYYTNASDALIEFAQRIRVQL